MKKVILYSAAGLVGATTATVGMAQELGHVISSTPVVQQVAVPHQVCDPQPIPVQQPSTGGGAVVGAVVGGLLGNTIGGGAGRAAATGLGIVGGAAVGDQVERRNSYAYAPNCTTQTSYESRTMGYDVQYEYAGKQYSTHLPYDPGQTIRLQVSATPDMIAQAPNGGAAQAPETGATPPPPQEPQGTIIRELPAGVPPTAYPAAPAPYPAYPAYGYAYPAPPYPYYPAPAYYPRYYYPPISLSLGFGYVSHGHH